MVKITVKCDSAVTTVLEFKDHVGDSLVCAAVSCLIYTLKGALTHNEALFDIKESPGDAKFIINVNGLHDCHPVIVIIETIVIGLLQLEKTHPDLVSVDGISLK